MKNDTIQRIQLECTRKKSTLAPTRRKKLSFLYIYIQPLALNGTFGLKKRWASAITRSMLFSTRIFQVQQRGYFPRVWSDIAKAYAMCDCVCSAMCIGLTQQFHLLQQPINAAQDCRMREREWESEHQESQRQYHNLANSIFTSCLIRFAYVTTLVVVIRITYTRTQIHTVEYILLAASRRC